ncbi:MAG: protein kinase [Acidobacteria bacterium]|nr:protein kinase [Acidobacteriota bacterium]
MEKIGKYKIDGEIQRGSMGIIYLGIDENLDRPVAVKVMNENLVADEQMVARFKNEAKAAALLNHPNIVTIHDFGEDSKKYFIVMELLKGEDLKKIIDEEKELDLEYKLDIIMKIAEGLKYAHSHNVIHRDIKPANIMLLENKDVKITDFGIAHLESSHITKTGTLVGTPDYMSPEQVLSQKIDNRSDIFSLGVIMYQLLSGRKPFQANSISSVMYKIANTEPPVFESLKLNIPFEVECIVMRALEKNPMKRYQELDEMISDLHTAKLLISGIKMEESSSTIAEAKYMIEEAQRLMDEERTEEAISVLKRAQRTNPDNKLLHTLHKKAENQLLKEKNQRIRSIITRAESTEIKGNDEEALVIAKSADDILPGNTITKEVLKRLKEKIRTKTGESDEEIEVRIFQPRKPLKMEGTLSDDSVSGGHGDSTEFHTTDTRTILMTLPKELRVQIEDSDKLYYRRKNVVEVVFAINKLMKALSIDNESYEAIFRLSRNYYMKGRLITRISEQKRAFNQGIAWGQKAIDINDNRVEGHYWLAVNLAKWGDVNGVFRGMVTIKKVIQHVEKVVELDDKYSGGGGYRVLGRIKFRLPNIVGGSLKESAELLEKAYAIEPKNPDTLIFLAETRMAEKKYKEAKRLLTELMTIEPLPQWRYETFYNRKDAEPMLQKLQDLL